MCVCPFGDFNYYRFSAVIFDYWPSADSRGGGGGEGGHFKGALRHSLFHHDVAEEEEEEESQVSDSPECDSDGEAIAQY